MKLIAPPKNLRLHLLTRRVKMRAPLICSIGILAFSALSARAANVVWDGGDAVNNAGWLNALNWNPDLAPLAGDALFFGGAAGLANTNDFAAATQFNGINFSAGAGAFVIGGNAVNLNGNIGSSSAAIETINLGFALQAATTNATVVPGGTLVLGGAISGATANFVKLGAGRLSLTSALNTYGGTTAINGGTLSLETTGVLNSSSPLTLGGGELALAGTAAAPRTQTLGALTFNAGRGTLTLAADAAQPISLTLAIATRNINSTMLYRGTGLGGTPGAGVANIFFTTPPTASNTVAAATVLGALGTGTLATTQAAVLHGALADTSATGTGIGFATYDPAVGVRLLTAGEQLTGAAATTYTGAATGDNVRLNIAGAVTITGKQTNTLQISNTFGSSQTVTNTGTALNPSNGLLFTGTSAITLTGGSLTYNSAANTGDMVILSTNTAGVTISTTLANGGSGQRGYTFGGAGNITVNSTITAGGTGAVSINGPGMVTFGASQSVSSQGFTVNGGTMRLATSFAMATSRPFKVANGATVETNGISVTNLDFFDGINGGGGTINNASGTASTLTITNGSTASGTLTFPGVISGNINLVRNTANPTVQVLSGSNTYTGTTTITAGTLSVTTLANGLSPSGIGASSNAAASLVIGAGTLSYTGGTVTSDRNFTVSGTGTIDVSDVNATLTLAGATMGGNTLTKTGAGALTLTGAAGGTGSVKLNVSNGTATLQGVADNAFLGTTITAGTMVLNKTSTASVHALGGTIALNGGTLKLSGSGGDQIFNSAAFTIGGGTFDLNGLSETTAAITTTSGTLASSVGGGVVSAASLSHSSGTLTINSGATFAGNATVSSGSVLVNGAINGNATISAGSTLVNGTVSGSVTVNGGTLGGSGSAGAVTVNSSGHLAPGTSIGTLTVGTLSLSAGSILDYEFGAGNDLTIVSTSGGLTLAGGGFNLYQTGGILPFSTVGTYPVIQYPDSISTTNLSVLNPQAGKTYSFASSGGFVSLTINTASAVANWASTTGGAWGDGPNWNTNPIIPNATGDAANFGSALAGPGNVTLGGNKTVGTLTFNNTNSYTIEPGSGGTLSLDNGGGAASVTSNSGSHTISAPVALVSITSVSVVSGGDTLTVSGAISGAGTLTKTGNGTLILGGTNTHAGTTVGGGIMQISNDANLGTTAATVVVNNATLQVSASTTSTRAVQLGSTGSTIQVDGAAVYQLDGSVTESAASTLNKTGTGTLILNGTASYTGGTSVANGTLQIGTGGATGALGAGPVTLAGTLAVNHTGTVTATGAITGAGNLTMTGGGTLLLSANSSGYSGPVTIAGSTLTIGASNGAGSGPLALNNATLRENNVSTTSTNAITVSGANFIDTFGGGNVMTLNGAISGAGNITRNGGTNTLSIGNSVGNQGFTGTFSNTTGNVSFTHKAAGSGNAQWSFTSGTVTMTSINGTISFGSLTGTSTINGTGNAARLNVGNLGIDTSYSGNLTGGANMAVLKSGTGALTLSGANVMSGQALSGLAFATAISRGTLVAASSTTGTTSGPLGGSGSAVLLGNGASGASVASLSSASLLTGGPYTLANPITVSSGSNTVTGSAYLLTLGGQTDNASAFSGAITLENNLTVSQVATTGGNMLLLSGGISGTNAGSGPGGAGTGPGNTGTQVVTFAGPGAIKVSSAITNGGGTVGVRVTAGTTTFSTTNTYTGATDVDGGKLIFSASQTLTSLNIADGATVELNATAPAPAPAFENDGGFGGGDPFSAMDAGALAAAGTQAVPEPGLGALLATGMLALLRRRR